MQLEEHAGSITIEVDEQGKICLTSEEAFDLLSWLADRKDTLYARVHHLQHVPEAARDEIAVWREVIAEEREQASKHTSAVPFQARADKESQV